MLPRNSLPSSSSCFMSMYFVWRIRGSNFCVSRRSRPAVLIQVGLALSTLGLGLLTAAEQLAHSSGPGTVVGALIMQVIATSFNMLLVPYAWALAFKAFIILFAVYLQRPRRV